jgi:hypothetical protein
LLLQHKNSPPIRPHPKYFMRNQPPLSRNDPLRGLK